MQHGHVLGLSVFLLTLLVAPVPTTTVFQDIGSCPVTVPTNPLFTPPSPYPATALSQDFWYGSEELWTTLRKDGTWPRLPRNANGLRQKVFWWHPGFDGMTEPTPDLTVTGRRLDQSGFFVHAAPATNAHHADFGGWAMLTGVDVPTPGCWELAGKYRGHTLTFVVWIPV